MAPALAAFLSTPSSTLQRSSDNAYSFNLYRLRSARIERAECAAPWVGDERARSNGQRLADPQKGHRGGHDRKRGILMKSDLFKFWMNSDQIGMRFCGAMTSTNCAWFFGVRDRVDLECAVAARSAQSEEWRAQRKRARTEKL